MKQIGWNVNLTWTRLGIELGSQRLEAQGAINWARRRAINVHKVPCSLIQITGQLVLSMVKLGLTVLFVGGLEKSTVLLAVLLEVTG